jgi:cellulose synthase/poly-beta-1,6-N-acetylglucosamine synthase-like glycosyltransferase
LAPKKSAIIGFTLLLDLFWFYGFYHLVIILFSYYKKSNISKGQDKDINLLLKEPAVALLYATCDDFAEEPGLSCLNQNYSNFHTFILDDSSSEEYKKRIDRFENKYRQKITVIRRRDRSGYKAGNINHGLKNITGYDYFSISDADTVLPPDYIAKLLPYFKFSTVAYVQARQEINPLQNSTFARQLGFQIELHCDHYLRTKNEYGFVMFYGHAAILRYDVWKEIGGMPEVATEDLAFSMKLREKGYIGVYAEDVVCYEDYPPTYQQYRKRNEKWIRGTAECLLKFYPSFFKCGHIGWVEKFDVLASALSLLLALPLLILLLLVGLLLPFYFSHFCFQGPMFKMPVGFNGTFLDMALKITGNLFWTWDFFLLFFIAVISPILPAVVEMFKHPRKRFQYIVMYTFMFYATQIVSSLNLITYLVTRKAVFPVTGQTKECPEEKTFKNFREFLSRSISNHKVILVLEAAFAALFIFISFSTDNIWFLSFGSGILIGILLFLYGLENKLLRHLVFVPLIVMVAVVLLIIKTLQ